jgi:hypothetical protein
MAGWGSALINNNGAKASLELDWPITRAATQRCRLSASWSRIVASNIGRAVEKSITRRLKELMRSASLRLASAARARSCWLAA